MNVINIYLYVIWVLHVYHFFVLFYFILHRIRGKYICTSTQLEVYNVQIYDVHATASSHQRWPVLYHVAFFCKQVYICRLPFFLTLLRYYKYLNTWCTNYMSLKFSKRFCPCSHKFCSRDAISLPNYFVLSDQARFLAISWLCRYTRSALRVPTLLRIFQVVMLLRLLGYATLGILVAIAVKIA